MPRGGETSAQRQTTDNDVVSAHRKPSESTGHSGSAVGDPAAGEPLSTVEMRSEINRSPTDVHERLVEVGQLRAQLRGARIELQQQAALLAQTTAAATAYKAELDDLKSGAGWMLLILVRRFETQFPFLGRITRWFVRLVWRIARRLRSRLRSRIRLPAMRSPFSAVPNEQPADTLPLASVANEAQAPLLDASRGTVLLIVHDASRTGGPILAYNIAKRLRERRNVVALLLSGGELVEDFRDCCAAVVGPVNPADLHPAQIHLLVDRLQRTYEITYAIANSIASRALLRPLTLARIPVLALVHEFPGYMLLENEMGPALEWATLTVFSSAMTAAAARASHQKLDNCPIHILRQGRPDLPPREGASIDEERDVKGSTFFCRRPPRSPRAILRAQSGSSGLAAPVRPPTIASTRALSRNN
jgi:hypothetical protein